jgi:hypothetical protein
MSSSHGFAQTKSSYSERIEVTSTKKGWLFFRLKNNLPFGSMSKIIWMAKRQSSHLKVL